MTGGPKPDRFANIFRMTSDSTISPMSFGSSFALSILLFKEITKRVTPDEKAYGTNGIYSRFSCTRYIAECQRNSFQLLS